MKIFIRILSVSFMVLVSPTFLGAMDADKVGSDGAAVDFTLPLSATEKLDKLDVALRHLESRIRTLPRLTLPRCYLTIMLIELQKTVNLGKRIVTVDPEERNVCLSEIKNGVITFVEKMQTLIHRRFPSADQHFLDDIYELAHDNSGGGFGDLMTEIGATICSLDEKINSLPEIDRKRFNGFRADVFFALAMKALEVVVNICRYAVPRDAVRARHTVRTLLEQGIREYSSDEKLLDEKGIPVVSAEVRELLHQKCCDALKDLETNKLRSVGDSIDGLLEDFGRLQVGLGKRTDRGDEADSAAEPLAQRQRTGDK